jgi:ABC-type spermidine/putrescine transport system permease subunit II
VFGERFVMPADAAILIARPDAVTIARSEQGVVGRLLREGAVAAWRGVAPILVWVPPMLLIAPLVMLAVGSFTEVWDSRGLMGASTEAYREALKFGGTAIAFSLKLATLVTAIVTVLAVPTAYALARYSGATVLMVKQILMLPIILPPMALAIGLIVLYPALSGTFSIFVLAHVVLAFPFAVWPIGAALTAMDFRVLETAARTLGASQLQSFFLVILPNIARAAIVGATTVFVVSIAEVNAGLFLSSADYRPLSVALLGAFMDFDIRVAAALTVIFTIVVSPAFVVMEVLLRRGTRT